MNRKKRALTIVVVLFIVLIGFPIWENYRDTRQARLDYALIEAIKAGDNQKILTALTEGANGEARDTGDPPSFQDLRNLLDHFRHPGTPPLPYVQKTNDDKHLPALLLLYQQALDKITDGHITSPDLVVVRALLDHGAKVNDRDAEGYTPLHFAAVFKGDAVSLLLARGADMEAKDNNVPLIMTASPEMTKVLLEHGANIEARDNSQNTPLIVAVEADDVDKVHILLEHGANVTAKNNEERTALSFVDSETDPDITALLRRYGAK